MVTTVRPVTPDAWGDLVGLFGPRGATSGCWCMWWRLTARQWEANGNEGNRRALAELVGDGRIPGLLAYRDGQPVGWVSVGPRGDFGRVLRSPVLRPVGPAPEPIWSVVCF